jgi:ABC-type multidrug transport system ATPase subunit
MFRQLTKTFAQCRRARSGGSIGHAVDRCPAIETTGLTVFRRHLPVLDDIRLVVRQGEIVAIMGPNGAGKSTLLKCLAGAMRFNRGDVRWFGSSEIRSPILRQRVGFLGHECSLYSELTVLENLIFAGRMHSIDRPGDRAIRSLEAAGLGWTAQRRVGALSQGLRRRVAIIRALVHEPRLILLDEPFASLDIKGRQWLEGLFREWRNGGQTVCFACHDVPQSRLLGHRIVWLDCGRVAGLETSDSASARRSA